MWYMEDDKVIWKEVVHIGNKVEFHDIESGC